MTQHMQDQSQLNPGQAAHTAELAYKVSDDHNAVVVYARRADQARRRGAELLDTEANEVEATRAPEFDRYAPQGGPTDAQLLDAGWWLSCQQCGREISRLRAEDLANHAPEDRPEALLDPQHEEGFTYCSPACLDKAHAQEAERHRRTEQAREATLARFPGVTVEQINLWSEQTRGYVQFVLPGHTARSGGLGWEVGSDEVRGSDEAIENLRHYLAQAASTA